MNIEQEPVSVEPTLIPKGICYQAKQFQHMENNHDKTLNLTQNSKYRAEPHHLFCNMVKNAHTVFRQQASKQWVLLHTFHTYLEIFMLG